MTLGHGFIVRRAYLDTTTNSPLTPTLSPSAGARGKSTYCRRSSLAPAEGERVGVRGLAVVLTGCALVRLCAPPELTSRGGCWHFVNVMSITVELDLPEAVAAKARAKGLLEPEVLTRLITREVSAEEDARDFFEMVRQLRSLPGEPMTMEEIQAEVDAVRAERAARENRR